MEIDISKLRDDLINYFGSATSFFPFASMDLIEVENASPSQLIDIAIKNNFDLDNYIVNDKVNRKI
ncbi:MAG: hypothetical protein IJ068_02190 [Bacilli bacterium]|nr:hypothetical protein [Bacilli bacterium]